MRQPSDRALYFKLVGYYSFMKDVSPQPKSPPDNVFNLDQRKTALELKVGTDNHWNAHIYKRHVFSAELVPLGEPCCALGRLECALNRPNSSPVCPNLFKLHPPGTTPQ
eukprot:scaffold210175_cov24-Tisochrysis_lutea.AAC.2